MLEYVSLESEINKLCRCNHCHTDSNDSSFVLEGTERLQKMEGGLEETCVILAFSHQYLVGT